MNQLAGMEDATAEWLRRLLVLSSEMLFLQVMCLMAWVVNDLLWGASMPLISQCHLKSSTFKFH